MPQKSRAWSHVESPFHEGEQAVQQRVGMRERMEQVGRNLVRDFMPDQHREFFEELPFVVLGSRDEDGALWASLLSGEPGFVSSPGSRRLVVRAEPLPDDPLARNLRVGAPLGMLGIELPTRRRNRENGHVVSTFEAGFELEVEQSFGNCQQYIQARAGTFASAPTRTPPSEEHARLSVTALDLLRRVDTTFVASSSRETGRGYAEGLDVSHRGGRPGFVRGDERDGASVLTLPDFSGNFMFNTFGNLAVNPRAGFLALDFAGGAVLSLTGTARVLWDDPRIESFEGAERLLEFRVHSGWLWRGILLDWSPPEPSPHLRPTGVWSR